MGGLICILLRIFSVRCNKKTVHWSLQTASMGAQAHLTKRQDDLAVFPLALEDPPNDQAGRQARFTPKRHQSSCRHAQAGFLQAITTPNLTMVLISRSGSPALRLAAISNHLKSPIQLAASHGRRHPDGTSGPNSPQISTTRQIDLKKPNDRDLSITTTSNSSNGDRRELAGVQRWTDPRNYRYWLPVQTRWSDNDSYGHMNNAKYYHLFDTIVNKFLLEECKEEDPSMGLVVHSDCNYLQPIGFPTPVMLGLATERIGRSSIVWRVGLWSATRELARDDRTGCHAFGSFVHVFVNKQSRKKSEITPAVNAGASRLLVSS